MKIRRVPPQFSRPPDPVNEVLLGGNLNLTCVAVGSPMPFVKWRRGLDEDITPENELPVGKSVLELNDIRSSANYTCIASSSLGVIEALAMVKVQCKGSVTSSNFSRSNFAFFHFSAANCTNGFEVIIHFD